MKNDELGDGYLYAEELLVDGIWREVKLTIKAVHKRGSVKAADGTPIDKPILEFEKTDRRLVLNKLNQRLTRTALGTNDVSKWIGKTLTIHAVVGDWFGQKYVAAIRVRVPHGTPKPFMKPSAVGKDLTGSVVN